MTHTPDRWCLVDTPVATKVFASWTGSYLGSPSWRLSSGNESVEVTKDSYLIKGLSGSVYECRKNAYGLTGYGASVLNHSKLEPMSEEDAIKSIKEL